MRILLEVNRLRLRDLGIVGTRHAVSEGLVFPFPHRSRCGGYMHDVTPKVVAIAVSTVMRMLRIFPQVELLLNVPIVLNWN